MSKRWSYLTVEVKAGITWTGTIKREKMQEELNRHGAQGWELVNVVMLSNLTPAMLVFKKEA